MSHQPSILKTWAAATLALLTAALAAACGSVAVPEDASSGSTTGAEVTTDSGVTVEACGMNGPCAPGSHCLFGDHECGTSTSNGPCPTAGYCSAPVSCTGIDGPPACGCDGKVYDSVCLANAAGVSTSKLGSCGPAPQGHFACGDVFCEKAAQICIVTNPDGCGFVQYECRDLPQGCSAATCGQCIDKANECLDVLECTASADGDILVNCTTF
jgi:hypothetical protein